MLLYQDCASACPLQPPPSLLRPPALSFSLYVHSNYLTFPQKSHHLTIPLWVPPNFFKRRPPPITYLGALQKMGGVLSHPALAPTKSLKLSSSALPITHSQWFMGPRSVLMYARPRGVLRSHVMCAGLDYIG